MTQDAPSYGGDRRRASPPSMQKTIFMSVAASLLVAAFSNVLTFMTAMTKMEIIIDSMDKRVVALEAYSKESDLIHKKIELELARYGVVLQRIQSDIGDVKSDMRALTYKPAVSRNLPQGE